MKNPDGSYTAQCNDIKCLVNSVSIEGNPNSLYTNDQILQQKTPKSPSIFSYLVEKIKSFVPRKAGGF